MPKLPGITHERAIRAFEKAGFREVRKGSRHAVMSAGERFITIPRHNPVDSYTMGGIIRDAGLTIEEFKKLL
jgi:predicted RNA binding protein YcfA (HicA-like mRNA interferase family)